MKKRVCLILTAMCFIPAGAYNIIPAPVEIRSAGNGMVNLKKTDARVDKSLKMPNEGYTLVIKGQTAVLRGKTPQALVWAQQTLRQLKDTGGRVPKVAIKDYPAFPVRGFHYDTGRNFRPVGMLKRDIDLLSFYKMNVFHWHLTDRPAWRIECKAYPRLNDPKYQRKGRNEGQFYTYAEIRDVIRYARERGVMIIPEIDMPGHSTYFDAAFGFSMASQEGMKVLKTLLEEFFSEIPAADCPYMHIGSDEVHVGNPKEFMTFCEDICQKHGRTPVCWAPGLTPTYSTTVRQLWYGNELEDENGNPVQQKSPFFDSADGYLNDGNPLLNTSRYFLHTLCATDKATDKALGGILCLWPDVRVADQNLVFPQSGVVSCLAAYAERAWRGGKMERLSEEQLLPTEGTAFHNMLCEFETRLSYHRDHFVRDWDMRWVANAGIPWRVTIPEARGTQRDDMKWMKACGGSINFSAVCKAAGVKELTQMDAWMETCISVKNDTTITAWLGFDTPNRATKRSDGMGPQGHWEAQGRLFVGDTEIFPDGAWQYPEKFRYHFDTWGHPEGEEPYVNEQFYWLRRPARLPLKRGRNIIRIYCPHVYDSRDWIISFMPMSTEADGHVREATGISYETLM